MVFHESCGRRMQGNWVRGSAHHRCRCPAEYAIANLIDHPKSVHIREDAVIEKIDTWLAGVFDADRIEHSLTSLEKSQPVHLGAQAQADPATSLEEYDRKLARHRAALEAGADPVLVTEWIQEVQRERQLAEAQIDASGRDSPTRRRMTRTEITEVVEHLGGLTRILRTSDARDKRPVYQQLGLKLTYNHEKRMVAVESQPRPSVGVLVVSGGGLEPPRPLIGH